jgi:hypothetical protein
MGEINNVSYKFISGALQYGSGALEYGSGAIGTLDREKQKYSKSFLVTSHTYTS